MKIIKLHITWGKGAFGMILVFFSIIMYWLFFPVNIIDFKSVTLDHATYKAGEPLTMTIDYCKYNDLPSHYSRQFVNGIVYTLPDGFGNAPKKCAVIHVTDLIIPKELPEGVFKYRQSMVYKVNPLRQETVVFETELFEVIESEVK